MGLNKGNKWTASNHNFYKSHLSMLFADLAEWESITGNPVVGIKKQKRPPKKKKVQLTLEQRQMLNDKLRTDNYPLWRMVVLFHSSGAREREFSRLKKEHVNMEAGTVDYTILKGAPYLDTRPMKDNVLHLWQEICNEAAEGDYLFSKQQKPGPVQAYAEGYSQLWRKSVKEKYKIEATMYSLKYLHATELRKLVGNVVSARMMGHADTTMIDKVYDTDRQDDINEIIRKSANDFSGSHLKSDTPPTKKHP